MVRDHRGRIPRLAIVLGAQLRAERLRQRRTLRQVAAQAGLSPAMVQAIERGRPGSLLSYEAVAAGLGVEIEAGVVDPRRRRPRPGQDALHAAMGELQARQMRANGLEVFVDEPYQHYQFAGRADLVAVDRSRAALLHVENRTRFPNVQEAIGAFNAKRSYLADVLGKRLGVRFASITHAMVVAWTAEAMHELRRHRATFAAVCPDPADLFSDMVGGCSTGSVRGNSCALRSDRLITAATVRRSRCARRRPAPVSGLRRDAVGGLRQAVKVRCRSFQRPLNTEDPNRRCRGRFSPRREAPSNDG